MNLPVAFAALLVGLAAAQPLAVRDPQDFGDLAEANPGFLPSGDVESNVLDADFAQPAPSGQSLNGILDPDFAQPAPADESSGNVLDADFAQPVPSDQSPGGVQPAPSRKRPGGVLDPEFAQPAPSRNRPGSILDAESAQAVPPSDQLPNSQGFTQTACDNIRKNYSQKFAESNFDCQFT
ncbi:uncharacterized protein MAM_06068 [Metarhizium album ARSEF 1941]|uniref:Uncharacterized protein n=1 Tax=Metarhizium album (strain ARSEF 1941) TaxID=1081103 RepID=A0A0B2WPL8_METAS|nr:uncharacterized protein MAM_06068 [Metarhizium album ARSEF 1941]KHN95963.1 hypothetical protein MAM_06068 [Metarhizium album ARSEF 1941]